MLKTVTQLIPPLLESAHKGQSGRVGVIGGCEEYTGAPYFAAISALKLGADISHVFCEESAAAAIKSYSPELIVHPYLFRSTGLDTKATSIERSVERIGEFLPRLHALVIGPGLGKDPKVLETVERVVVKAKELDICLVFDADGLFLIQQKPELVDGYKNAILTPNSIEFERLCSKMEIQRTKSLEDEVITLAHAMGGPTIIQKGRRDIISDGNGTVKCEVEGSLRRCGGQGDILSGLAGTFSAWAAIHQKEHGTDSINGISLMMLASFGACSVTRNASSRAFKQHGRSTVASDLIPHINYALENLFPAAL